MTMDQQFIDYVVKSIVSKPEDVKIERSIDEKGVLLELTVNPEDLGRVIGKRGNTAQSMRTLLRALGTKDDARYNLKIIDNGEPKPKRDNDSSSRKQDDSSDDNSSDDSSDNSADNAPEAAAAGAGASQWAHMSSDNDESEDDDVTDQQPDEEEESSTSSTSSVVEQTKKELADLDDLNL